MARILVIDDNNDTVEALRKLLEAGGHEVETASSGMDALLILRDKAMPDLAILDVQMPVMKGPELLCHINDNGPPVIVMTGDYDILKSLNLKSNPMVKHIILKGTPTLLQDLQKSIADVLGDAT
jgi:CheY-like chemotaxis protein